MTAATGAWADVTWSLSDGTLTISGTGAMADYSKASAQPWSGSRTSITSIVVGEGVTHIGNSAFRTCTNVTSISLPTTLETIGDYAFQGCDNEALTSITIPENLTTIGNFAFQSCSSLTTVTIPDKVMTIGQSAFQDCSSLTSVDIPNSVETIYYFKFLAKNSANVSQGIMFLGCPLPAFSS